MEVILRVGQNHIYTPYMTVCMVISLLKIPYVHRIYMVLANPRYTARRHLTTLHLYVTVVSHAGLLWPAYGL